MPRLLPLVLSLAVALSLGGCRPSPERIEELRRGYQVEFEGFVVHQEPPELPEDPVETGEEARLEQEVRLSFVISREAGPEQEDEALPGVTLDVVQNDAGGKEKRRWRVWAKTVGIEPGPGARMAHILPDVDYRPGDTFTMEIVPRIPPETRGEYRELAGDAP